jgi:hypothetical protein
MDPDGQLAKKVSLYQEVAKENPNVNVGLLMVNALENQRQNMVSAKGKHWAYLISIGAPPLGLLCALRYFLGDEDDASQTAWTCVILTALGILMFYVSYKLFFASTNVTPQQIEQIKPSDIMQLTQ